MRERRALAAWAALALALGLCAMARTEISTGAASARDRPLRLVEAPDADADAPMGAAARALRDGETVDLNGATRQELELLPGIGPTLAERIVAHRSAEGPFETLESLAEVRGVGPATLERLRDLVTIER